ncbi:methyltransferase [Candidatus Woesearchaeota archaeon]|nr:methyltransferase [Candidatus Woesearchaeota archaeon]
MRMVFDKEMETQEIWAVGNELARWFGHDGKTARYTLDDSHMEHIVTFHDPVLVTDNALIARLADSRPGPFTISNYAKERGITGSMLRDSVNRLMEVPRRIIEYDGTVMDFDQSRYDGGTPETQVWGPSYDTLFLCKALGMIDLGNAKNAAELGAGSGFVSMYLMDHLPDLERMVSIDRMALSYQCMLDMKKQGNYNKWDPVAADAMDYLKGKNFDLLVCNPPYIRRPKSIDDNPYEGIGMIADLIENSDELLNDGGRLVINISSLSGDLPYELLDVYGRDFSEVLKKEVPLKVFRVTNDPEWREYLIEHGLDTQSRRGHDYWQEIKVLEIRK